MTYRDFFKQLTGFEPSDFQERVADQILTERNVLLQAPTGGGKSWAVIAPFLYSLNFGQSVADRLQFALPLRSLATSLYQSTWTAIHECSATSHHAQRIRIQTGEQRDDALFEGLVTFSTIDQLLSSYLLQPVGLPARCGNINAGATLGSLICFDEFHLLDPRRSMATAIEMLDTIAVANPLSRFVLMTATLSTTTLRWLEKKLNARLIDLTEDEVSRLPSQQGKVRHYRWVDRPLTAADVVHVHGGQRSIVIANSVTRAQELYEDLCSSESRQALGASTEILLLHSRFYPGDRQCIERRLDQWFGPKPTSKNVILVSTQVIEAGLDLSCENLHSEVAPLNAIVQRAGRCARRKGETGTVWCYDLVTDTGGQRAYGPYRDLSDLVDSTVTTLESEIGKEGRRIHFKDELEFVNAVHSQPELQSLQPLENLQGHRDAIRIAMDGENPAAPRDLIRDISSVNVIITDNPELLDFNRQKWPEMLSVPPTSLYRLFKDGSRSAEGWTAKCAVEREVFQGGTIQVDWREMTNDRDLAQAGWLIAIHPDHASYDSRFGLRIGQAGPKPAIRYRVRPKISRYSYRREEYSEHIRRVCAAGTRRDSDNRVVCRRLSAMLGISEEQLNAWTTLVYALHDIGKLSIDWQNAVWKWQEFKSGNRSSPRPAIAHTDYDPENEWKPARDFPRRPPHAAESAYAAASILASAFVGEHEPYRVAALTAIARHHGGFTESLSSFRLIPDASVLVGQSQGMTDAPAVANSPEYRFAAIIESMRKGWTSDKSLFKWVTKERDRCVTALKSRLVENGSGELDFDWSNSQILNPSTGKGIHASKTIAKSAGAFKLVDTFDEWMKLRGLWSAMLGFRSGDAFKFFVLLPGDITDDHLRKLRIELRDLGIWGIVRLDVEA